MANSQLKFGRMKGVASTPVVAAQITAASDERLGIVKTVMLNESGRRAQLTTNGNIRRRDEARVSAGGFLRSAKRGENGPMTNPIGLIRRGSAFLLVGLLVTLLAGANLPAQAAPLSPPTFTVNSPFDVVASPPLDSGPCETAPGNATCTLRAAIEKANNFPGGGATIILPALSGGGVYALTIDELTITSTMTLIGGGAANTIIDGISNGM